MAISEDAWLCDRGYRVRDWLVDAVEFLVVLSSCELGEVGLGRNERASGVLVLLLVAKVFTLLRHTTHAWIVVISTHHQHPIILWQTRCLLLCDNDAARLIASYLSQRQSTSWLLLAVIFLLLDHIR